MLGLGAESIYDFGNFKSERKGGDIECQKAGASPKQNTKLFYPFVKGTQAEAKWQKHSLIIIPRL